MYELYRFNKSTVLDYDKIKMKGASLKVSKRKVTISNVFTNNHIIYDLYWYLNTNGNCWVYSVFDGNHEVHHSYTTNRLYKFPFMKVNDLQIGNCYTNPFYRGKGIYPYIIKYIVEEHLKNYPVNDVYMLIEEENISSQSGVKKVGFEKIFKLETIKILGVLKKYVVLEE